MIPSVLLAASFQLRSLCSSHKFIAIQNLLMNISKIFNSLKIIHEEENNLENNWQRNLKTDRAMECIFWASGGKILRIFVLCANHGDDAFGSSRYVPVCQKIFWISRWRKLEIEGTVKKCFSLKHRLGKEEKDRSPWSPLAFSYPRRVVNYRWSKKITF